MHLNEDNFFSDYLIYIINLLLIAATYALIPFFELYEIIIFIILALIILPLYLFSIKAPAITILITFCAALIGPLGSIFSSESTTIPFTPFQIAFIFTIIILISSPTYFFRKIKNPGNIILYMLFFSALLLIYTIFSLDRFRAIYHVFTFWLLIAFTYLVYYFYEDRKFFKYSFHLLLIITLFLSLMSLYLTIDNPQALIINALNSQSKVFGRQVGVWEDPNDFGLVLILPLLYLISKIFIYNSQLNKLALTGSIISFIFILIALLSTYSRSAWLAFFLSAVYLFAYTKKTKRLLQLITFVFVLLAIITVTNDFIYQVLQNRILSIFDVTKNTSNMGRIILAKAALEMFYDSNFMGVGFMSFAALASKYFNPALTQGVIESHNLSLTLLAETGILGFLSFYAIFYNLFKSTKSTINDLRNEEKIFFSTLRSYIVAVLIFYQFYPGALHFNLLWFSVGALLALKVKVKPNIALN